MSPSTSSARLRLPSQFLPVSGVREGWGRNFCCNESPLCVYIIAYDDREQATLRKNTQNSCFLARPRLKEAFMSWCGPRLEREGWAMRSEVSSCPPLWRVGHSAVANKDFGELNRVIRKGWTHLATILLGGALSPNMPTRCVQTFVSTPDDRCMALHAQYVDVLSSPGLTSFKLNR